jgi:hypothetical protein
MSRQLKYYRVILWGMNCALANWGDAAFREIALAWLGVKEQQPDNHLAKAA